MFGEIGNKGGSEVIELVIEILLDDVVKPDEAAFNPFEILGVEVRQTVALRYATRILALCLCPHVCGSVYAYYARAFVPVPAAVD